MNRAQILERERQGARFAGIAAVAAAPLYIVSVALDQGGSVPLTGLDTERFRAIDESSTELLALGGAARRWRSRCSRSRSSISSAPHRLAARG